MDYTKVGAHEAANEIRGWIEGAISTGRYDIMEIVYRALVKGMICLDLAMTEHRAKEEQKREEG